MTSHFISPYCWEQTFDEVILDIVAQPPPSGRRVRDHFQVHIGNEFLRVNVVDNRPLLDGILGGPIHPDASTWTWNADDGKIHVILCKANPGEAWSSAIKDDPERTLSPVEQENAKKAMLLQRFQLEHPGFDFSGANVTGAAPDAREFLGGIDRSKLK